MIDRQVKGDTGKRSCPARITVCNRFGIEFRAIRIGRADNNYQILSAVLFDRFQNCFLTFQVKGSRGSSDKTLSLG